MSELTATELRTMTRRELAELMDRGHPIDASALQGYEYRGVSLSMPRVIEERVLWKTFKKTFYRDPDTDVLRGWNVRIAQRPDPWTYQPMRRWGGKLKTFGHYIVTDASGRSIPRGWNQGVFLDYGAADNPLWDPARQMRAPVVAVNEGSVELLLGWDYLQLGPLKVPTTAYWSLERDCPLSHMAP